MYVIFVLWLTIFVLLITLVNTLLVIAVHILKSIAQHVKPQCKSCVGISSEWVHVRVLCVTSAD